MDFFKKREVREPFENEGQNFRGALISACFMATFSQQGLLILNF